MNADNGRPRDGQDPDSSASGGSRDDDAVWAELVARLEATDSGAADDTAPGDRTAFSAFDPLGLSGRDALPSDTLGGPRDYAPDPEVEEELERFVPEDPAVFSNADPRQVLAWAGAAGAPLLVVLFLIFWRSAPPVLWWFLVLAFAAGVGYLIWRLPHGSDEDRYDDGARL
ncbi:hypothetical protein [Arthrobacter sp. NPDC090010]|uniref:hypothetical protein n=1 Tax=Arthrobacter sp. NPDC090010 TaxID=3363942 RepID=UPI00382982CA